ncbi:hypothetical protein DFH28DRAFT_218987 [Melampsora americana]|nr:hypothetical protein DFH28DRAFT_218987 [Melampsora americana]
MKLQVPLIISIMILVGNQASGFVVPASQASHLTSTENVSSHNVIGSSSVVLSTTQQEYLENLKNWKLIHNQAQKEFGSGCMDRYMATGNQFCDKDLDEDNKATCPINSAPIPKAKQYEPESLSDSLASKFFKDYFRLIQAWLIARRLFLHRQYP